MKIPIPNILIKYSSFVFVFLLIILILLFSGGLTIVGPDDNNFVAGTVGFSYGNHHISYSSAKLGNHVVSPYEDIKVGLLRIDMSSYFNNSLTHDSDFVFDNSTLNLRLDYYSTAQGPVTYDFYYCSNYVGSTFPDSDLTSMDWNFNGINCDNFNILGSVSSSEFNVGSSGFIIAPIDITSSVQNEIDNFGDYKFYILGIMRNPQWSSPVTASMNSYSTISLSYHYASDDQSSSSEPLSSVSGGNLVSQYSDGLNTYVTVSTQKYGFAYLWEQIKAGVHYWASKINSFAFGVGSNLE